MKPFSFFLLFYCSIVLQTQGQNLVPNPGFEIFDTCYINGGGLDTSATFFPRIDNWMAASVGCSGVAFTPCQGNAPFTQLFGYHVAHSGVSYAGLTACAEYPISAHLSNCHLCTNTRSYIQVQLNQPLKKSTQYCVDFFVECAVNSTNYVCTSSIAAYLSAERPMNDNTTVQNSLITGIQPQIQNAPNNFIIDTLHWQSIHGIYKAKGGEQWLTIGNFNNDTLTPILRSYYYPDSIYMDSLAVILIDDVSVTPITFPQASRDTLLCDTNRFTETLMAQPGGAYYQWNTRETTTTITIHQPGTYWYNTDFGCGPVVDSIHIKFQPPLSGHLPADTNGCAANMPVYLRIDSGFEHYAWNTGDTTAVIAVSDSGTYSVHAVYACGAFSDTVHVAVYPQPALPTAIDTGICVNTGNYLPVISGSDIHYYSSLIDSTGSLVPPEIATATAGSHTFYAAQQVSGCFSGRSTEHVQVIAAPEPDVINNLTLCEG